MASRIAERMPAKIPGNISLLTTGNENKTPLSFPFLKILAWKILATNPIMKPAPMGIPGFL